MLQKCVWCHDDNIADEWAQIHGTTGEDPMDYQPMCRKHHARYDVGYSMEMSDFRDGQPNPKSARWNPEKILDMMK